MSLHRIIYSSKATTLAKDDLENIIASSTRNNPKVHVTGMLLFDSGHFLQLLEGSLKAISDRFLAIVKDERHSDVLLHSAGQIEARLFADWSMHHVVIHGQQAEILKRYSSGPTFTPSDLPPRAMENLCFDYATSALKSTIK